MKLPTRLTWSRAVAVVAVIVVACWWCEDRPSVARAQPAVPCTNAQPPGPNLTATVGEQVVLILESNRTTGYQWKLGQQPDASVLRYVGSEYVPPTSGAIGAGGSECWTFQAVGAGTTTLTLEYVRPFEVGVPPARTASATVTVRPAIRAAVPSQLPRTGEAAASSPEGALALGLLALALGIGCWRGAVRGRSRMAEDRVSRRVVG